MVGPGKVGNVFVQHDANTCYSADDGAGTKCVFRGQFTTKAPNTTTTTTTTTIKTETVTTATTTTTTTATRTTTTVTTTTDNTTNNTSTPAATAAATSVAGTTTTTKTSTTTTATPATPATPGTELLALTTPTATAAEAPLATINASVGTGAFPGAAGGTTSSSPDAAIDPQKSSGEETTPPPKVPADGAGASAVANTTAGQDGGGTSDPTTAVVGGVLGSLVLVLLIFIIVREQAGGKTFIRQNVPTVVENQMYDYTHAALADGNSGTSMADSLSALESARADHEQAQASAYDEVGGPANAAQTSNANSIEADYENPDQIMAAAGKAHGGNGMVDENNIYNMHTPGRRRTQRSAATVAAAVGGNGGNGVVDQNNVYNMLTPGRRRAATTVRRDSGSGSGSGGRPAQPRPESGEVFYDSFAPSGAGDKAVTAGAPQGSEGSNAIYAQSTKQLKKQPQPQQQQQPRADANATYASPVQPMPEQDYETLNEAPSNDEASVIYDAAAASAANSGGSAPTDSDVDSEDFEC